MSFTTAVRSALRQYVTFSVRARRSEFWWFYLFTLLAALGAAIIDDVLFGVRVADTQPYEVVSSASGPVGTVVALVLLLPTLAAAVRRLHDVGLSGWFLLVGLVPLVGWVILLVALLRDSGPDNVHGPSPKRPAPTGPVLAVR